MFSPAPRSPHFLHMKKNWAPPFPLNYLWNAWMAFGRAVGKVMSAIILSILWLVAFGVYGIILRIAALVRPAQQRATWWVDVRALPGDSLRRQF